MLISISVLNASEYMRERSRHVCDKIIFNMYFIFYILYHATLEKEKMSGLHVRTIFYSVHYIVRTDIVRTSVRTTHNRTYLFLRYTFFLRYLLVFHYYIYFNTLSVTRLNRFFSVLSYFLQFICSRWVMGKRKPNYFGVLGGTSLYGIYTIIRHDELLS